MYLFNEGTHARLYKHLGAHFLTDGAAAHLCGVGSERGSVSVVGDFNDWNTDRIPSCRTPEAEYGRASFAASGREQRTSFTSDPDIAPIVRIS